MIPDEREWQAQEKAMRCERAGIELPASDTLGAAYLPIAQALSRPLQSGLPDNFAARVAAMAGAGPRPAEVESQLEQWLLLALAIVFGTCALAAVVVYGNGNWLGNAFSMLARAGAPTLAWPMALAGCLLVSWFSEALRKHRSDHGRSRR